VWDRGYADLPSMEVRATNPANDSAATKATLFFMDILPRLPRKWGEG